MVLKPEPVFNAMEDINHNEHTRVILMCPQGRPFTQEIAQELSEAKHIVFICDTMKDMMSAYVSIL